MTRVIVLMVLAAPAFGQESVIKPAPVELGRPVNFSRDILPIFRSNCLACHNSTTNENDLILETAAQTIKGRK